MFAVAALVALMVLRYGYNSLSGMFEEREKQITSLQNDIERKKLLVVKAQRAAKRLADYEARSLPSDREAARSQYQHWLMTTVDKSGLVGGVTSQTPQSQRGVFERFTFTVNASGTLPQVVKLLHDFAAVNHLHQLRMISLKPVDDGKRLEVLVSIEAIALPTAQNATQLVSKPSDRLKLPNLAAYQKAIVDRNVFAEYTPPQRERAVIADVRPPTPPFDPAKYTTVTGIINEFGRPEVWLNNRTSGDILKLSEGGQFEVGDVSGTIRAIGADAVEVSIDGQLLKLTLGQNLREATPVQ